MRSRISRSTSDIDGRSAILRVRGARQHTLRNLDLDLPLGELTVVTGPSGSGKSSLAFDTIYAEGQRRYVETFSPYARQFLERMDKPAVDRIEGIPPSIAIRQVNPVRTSRSTVGTMTEVNDRLKLLFARAGRLRCPECARDVVRDTPETLYDELHARGAAVIGKTVEVVFPVYPGKKEDAAALRARLTKAGYRRIRPRPDGGCDVVQDRVVFEDARRARLVEAFETAFLHGCGRLGVAVGSDKSDAVWRFSTGLHCPYCDRAWRDPTPNLFSFNSPIGACEKCRGFGRVIGIDPVRVVPDSDLSLENGAIRPFQGASYRDCLTDLLRFAKRRKVPVNVPWRALSTAQRAWVYEGEGDWEDGVWYGVRRFFDWLESKAYRMHVRVQLAKYREYRLCDACGGARLRPEALDWFVGFDDLRHTMPSFVALPLEEAHAFISEWRLGERNDPVIALLLDEMHARLGYLVEVGLGYLTLDRQSRTLSGGEVQRINLTTALGSSLVNTLFVLDEPSIGLHPRDVGRLVKVLRRLRDAGNSLLLVEHDPQVIEAADRIVEMGPGPGADGGSIVFNGAPTALRKMSDLPTGAFLSGRRRVGDELPPGVTTPFGDKSPQLIVRGARAHNLQGIDVVFPLDRLVVVAGVSGSGKSTLVETVLHRNLLRRMGSATDEPGACDAIEMSVALADVVSIDQAAIGKSARSNPAGYVGAFEGIRKLFAAQPDAVERGFTAGSFSFNSGKGRCPGCAGAGFEHVEMQFLSDVYLRCPECDGSRYRTEVLEVRVPLPGLGRLNIAEVLDLTVAQARAAFEDASIRGALEPLEAVGLGYLPLGQPVPTLSGGEAQRLKLAGRLAGGAARARGRKQVETGRTLFLLDEPTTGLHLSDVARLLLVLRRLVAAGHAVIVIEHHLDVMAAADWLIDLGPEGGSGGGHVVAAGPPAVVAASSPAGHTALALVAHAVADNCGAGNRATGCAPPPGGSAKACPPPARKSPRQVRPSINVLHAREHNLRDFSVRIPRDVFTVITGVSGSGKSTLAFDILFAEGQRRYLECLNAYARQFVQTASRPDVDRLTGIPPSVAIEQRLSRGGYKSTVATVAEIDGALRLLFARLGIQHCPGCAVPIQQRRPGAIVEELLRSHVGRRIEVAARLVDGRKGIYRDLAEWALARGIGALRVDGVDQPTGDWPKLDRYREHDIDWVVATLDVDDATERSLREAVETALQHGKDTLRVVRLGRGRPKPAEIFSTRRACPSCGRGFAALDPRALSHHSRRGWCPRCQGAGVLLPEDVRDAAEVVADADAEPRTCPICEGRRLNAEARSVRFRGRGIDDIGSDSVASAITFFRSLSLYHSLPPGNRQAPAVVSPLDSREREIARDLLPEIVGRLGFLEQVGLDYLGLDRAAPTLSGGEAQRLRLAAQLGSSLRGVCYVLDEPTIGLHAADNERLLDSLETLQKRGNTVLVVEHDEATIRRARHVIDLGPGAGRQGGCLVAQGTPKQIARSRDSVTGRCLRRPLSHPMRGDWRPTTLDDKDAGCTNAVAVIRGATLHNLRNIDVSLPLGRLVAVTGVSGSGKSTLVRDVLMRSLRRRMGRRGRPPEPHGCAAIEGADSIQRVLEVDQTPIGRTPRSCPATYVGLWDAVRRLFAATPEARLRGYGPGRFSFNTGGGRCPECEGQGIKRVAMSFLPDVTMVCERCEGARFSPETLDIRFGGVDIAELLAMSVEDARDRFAAHPSIQYPLNLLCEVGLGYLALGQRSPTLSGGEAQRLKLVTELARCRTTGPRPSEHTLYVLDEPSVGLHMADVEKLMPALHRLVDAGHSVILIEHNLDLIAEADWIIDMGPGGGDAGGDLVAQGPPPIVAAGDTATGRYLRPLLNRHPLTDPSCIG